MVVQRQKLEKKREQLLDEIFKHYPIVRAIFDSVQTGISIAIDTSCSEIIHNPVAAKFLRINPWESLSQSSGGRPTLSFFQGSKQLSPHELPVQRAVWYGEETYNKEFEVVWEDGVRKTALLNSNPIRNDAGEIIGAVASFQDITEQRLMDRQFEQFFQLSLDSFIIMDFSGKIIKINPILNKVLGYKEVEISTDMETLVTDLVHPDDLGATLASLQQLKKGQAISKFVNRLRSKRGEYKWFSWSSFPLVDHGLIYSVGRDITENKLHAEELIKSKEQITHILESISDAFYSLDNEGRFLYINKAANQLFSYTKTAWGKSMQEFLGMCVYDSFPKYKGSDLHEIHKKVVATQVPAHLETKLLYGQTDVEVHVYPFKEGISVYFRDITERKQTERRLVRANSRITNLLESITDGFFSVDNEWCFTYVNNAAEKIFNKKRSDLLGKSLWDIYPETPLTFEEQYRKAKASGETFTFEGFSKVLKKWVRVTAYPSKNGLTIFLRDLTAQVKTLEELKNSEERFYKAFHNSSSAMVIQRQYDNRYIDVNKAFERITGYTREEVIGRSQAELKIWVEEEEQQTTLMQNFINQGSASNAEIRIRTKQGKTRTALLSADIIAANGEHYILIVAQDITEIRNLEEGIRRLDRLNSVAQLAASLSHEVRNPMTTVRGFLQMFKEKPSYQKDKEIFQLMIEELDRANELISGFLSMSNRQGSASEMKNLNKIINDLYPLLLGDAIKSDKNILLNQQATPDIKLNKKEIHQLILNLARNGLEAMPPGGKLMIGTFLDQGEVVLSVKDEGNGIPPEILAKLGTPFNTSKEHGTGMGLAVCYGIAARHHAKIQVETSSKGTEFSVRFPTKHLTEINSLIL